MSGRINAADIPAEVLSRLAKDNPALGRAHGIRKSRATSRRSMTLDAVRSAAIRVLYVVHELTPGERARVLRHALKVNDV